MWAFQSQAHVSGRSFNAYEIQVTLVALKPFLQLSFRFFQSYNIKKFTIMLKLRDRPQIGSWPDLQHSTDKTRQAHWTVALDLKRQLHFWITANKVEGSTPGHHECLPISGKAINLYNVLSTLYFPSFFYFLWFTGASLHHHPTLFSKHHIGGIQPCGSAYTMEIWKHCISELIFF